MRSGVIVRRISQQICRSLPRHMQPIEDWFECLTQVFHQVKAIGNLDSIWSTLRSAFGVVFADKHHRALEKRTAQLTAIQQ